MGQNERIVLLWTRGRRMSDVTTCDFRAQNFNQKQETLAYGTHQPTSYFNLLLLFCSTCRFCLCATMDRLVLIIAFSGVSQDLRSRYFGSCLLGVVSATTIYDEDEVMICLGCTLVRRCCQRNIISLFIDI